MAAPTKPLTAVLGALALTVGLASCGQTASTSGFKGESHNVAQAVSNFQSDATAADQKKICENDLAATLTKRLGSVGGCQATIKNQLREVDALSLTIEAIKINGTSAVAKVKSTYAGKNRITTLMLAREGSHWKISGVGSASSS